MTQTNNIIFFNLLSVAVISFVFYTENTNLQTQILEQNKQSEANKEIMNRELDTIIKDNNALKEEIQIISKKQNDIIYTMNELGKMTSYLKQLNIKINTLSKNSNKNFDIKRRLSDLESNDIILEEKMQLSSKFLEKNILDNTNNLISNLILEIKKIQKEHTKKKKEKNQHPRSSKDKYFNKPFLRDYLIKK